MLHTTASVAQYVNPLNLQDKKPQDLKVGAEQTAIYFPLLKGKSVAFVGNQTSVIGKTHLVDTLLAMKVNIKKIFFPEHGFRGDEDAGEQLKTYKDKRTGLACISLYGKENKKPSPEDLKNVDVVI